MKNETKTRARQRHADRWEEREAEAWDNIMKDLKPDEEPTVPPTVEAALNGQYKMKDLIKTAFSLKGDTADYEVIESRLNAGGRVSGMNLSILFFAILIASIGLNTNSTAVIIGAMLISPLMGTIQLMGLGIATADMMKFKRAMTGFLFQVITALVTSTIYFLLSPVKEATSELMGRTAPSVFDILIATFGGLAGISTDGIPQAVFYLAGLVCWNYFQDCLSKCSDTFNANQAIFGKVYFPRLVVPLSIVISNLIKMAIQFTLFLVVSFNSFS